MISDNEKRCQYIFRLLANKALSSILNCFGIDVQQTLLLRHKRTENNSDRFKFCQAEGVILMVGAFINCIFVLEYKIFASKCMTADASNELSSFPRRNILLAKRLRHERHHAIASLASTSQNILSNY